MRNTLARFVSYIRQPGRQLWQRQDWPFFVHILLVRNTYLGAYFAEKDVF